MCVMVWINPRTAWERAVDAAAALTDDEVVLLLVTNAADAPRDALAGLLGPAGHEPGESFSGIVEEQAAALFDEAEARLGRPARRLWVRGVPEREVVAAAADADVLICVRDGDPDTPGRLGPAARYVVDHVPCGVLLVRPAS